MYHYSVFCCNMTLRSILNNLCEPTFNFRLSVTTEVIILTVVKFALGPVYVGSVANFAKLCALFLFGVDVSRVGGCVFVNIYM
jgi:hypothetical protein